MIDRDFWTYSDLARECGCTSRFVQYLIKGQRRSEKYEACVARVLGIPKEDLTRLLRP